MISPIQQRRVLLVSLLIGIIAISIQAQEDNVALRGHNRRLQENVMVYDSGEPPVVETPAEQPPEVAEQPGETQEEERDGEDWSPPELTQEEIEAKQIRSYLGGLYPAVDVNMCPIYLRDTADMTAGYTMDLYSGGGKPVLRNRDLAFFWHIPRSGGSTVKNILNYCYDLRRAEQLGDAPSLDYARNNVLNVDTTSPDGLQFAQENNIVSSNMVDVIVSNYFLSGSALFNDEHYGKTFTMLRHPVEVATSLFYQRRKYIEAWKSMSFYDYVAGDAYLDSWQTRQLTGTMPWVPLTEEHLEQAKNTLKTKVFVGVLTEMEETLRQLKAHYGWGEKIAGCEKAHLSDPASVNDHPVTEHGKAAWKILVDKEKWDMALYYYGLELFAEQRNRYPPKDQAEQDVAEAAVAEIAAAV